MTKLYILNGPGMGESFELRDGTTYVGRSLENDIRIEDNTVSRRHLKIDKKGKKYLITDLESRNGTFFNGNLIAPGIELQAKEGEPIAIGMSVICLGHGSVESMMSLVDSIGLTSELGGESGIFVVHGDKTNQKKLELLYRVSETLAPNLPIYETLEKVLDQIFEFLKSIDRAAFILVDPESETILDVVSKACEPENESSSVYCPDVVSRVIESKEPVVVSNVQTEEENDDELLGTLKILRIESVMCVPMISGSRIMGVIYVDSIERPYGFGREDLQLFMDLSQRTALTVENARFAFDSTSILDNLRSHN
jgi:putative methionine-R-sulfoxide reductase with GAF domain